jgi:hypothetical protein
MKDYKYFNNCVNWEDRKVNQLISMIDDSIEITRKTFLEHIELPELRGIEISLGYSEHPKKGMMMSQDCYVTYHRSKINTKRVYYFTQSGIEHIFTFGGMND